MEPNRWYFWKNFSKDLRHQKIRENFPSKQRVKTGINRYPVHFINEYLVAYWVIFYAVLSSSVFFQNQLFGIFFSWMSSVSNSLDPDQARHYVGPDLHPNGLPRLSADDTRRQRVNKKSSHDRCMEPPSMFQSQSEPSRTPVEKAIGPNKQTYCSHYQPSR